MEAISHLMKIVVEKAWAIGLPIGIFCSLILLSPRFGLPPVRPEAQQWASTGLLAGSALVLTSLITWSLQILRRAGQWTRRRISTAQKRLRDQEEAIANLQTLSRDERRALRGILMSGVTRFEVHAENDAYGLVQKGQLRVLNRLGFVLMICELRPEVAEMRQELIDLYADL